MTLDGATLAFGILGPVELRSDDRVLELTSAKQQALLGAGLLHANAVVSAGQFVDALWGEHPPQSASALVQTYVSALRRLLGSSASGSIVTRAPGYVVHVADGALDLHQFDRLTAEAEVAAAAGDHRLAARLLRDALDRWRGPALAGLDTPVFRAAAARLEESRLAAIEHRIDAETHLGPPGRLVAELTELVAAHPLREGLRGLLMRTLYRIGRQAEALQVYQHGYRALRDELGVEPGPALQRLHRAILNADPSLSSGLGGLGGESVAVVEPSPGGPRQLPPPPAHFVGRTGEHTAVSAVLWSAAKVRRPVLAVVTGPAGAGKTALAHVIGDLVRDAFPDGQLYVPMRATSATGPTAVVEALGMLLRAVGTTPPEGADERAAALRTALAGRRMLLVLDDVWDAADVHPFLSGCAVLVTGRPALTCLDAEVRVELGPLAPAEAVQLLGRVAGAARVEADPDAAAGIAAACEGLPLAVRAAGARLAARSGWSLPMFAARLADGGRRLDELSAGSLDVRAGIAGSHRRLTGPDAAALRLLSGQPDLSLDRVAGLLDLPCDRAEVVADRLVDARLLDDEPAQDGGRRYRLSQLVGLYALETASALPPAGTP